MVWELLEFGAVELVDEPAALACPRLPTGESNGGTVGVDAGVGAAVTVADPLAVAVLLTGVGAVVEGVGVEGGNVVTGGPVLAAAVVLDAGGAAAVAAEVEAKIVGIFELPVLLSVEPVAPLLERSTATLSAECSAVSSKAGPQRLIATPAALLVCLVRDRAEMHHRIVR